MIRRLFERKTQQTDAAREADAAKKTDAPRPAVAAGQAHRTGQMAGPAEEKESRGSETWIPFASYCTTGQFMHLQNGYILHCGPTAAVNVIRTLENREDRNTRAEALCAESKKLPDRDLFLQCAEIGRRSRIYWNRKILGHFGGTSNFLTGIFLRRCLRAVRLEQEVAVRFHPWITADAVERALEKGAIVFLQVYWHPKYKNHHMLCYAVRGTGHERRFLLADGWAAGPVWVGEKDLGHGHFLTILISD